MSFLDLIVPNHSFEFGFAAHACASRPLSQVQRRVSGCFWIPVAAAEHRSPPRGCRETFDRARGALFSARRVRRAPGWARGRGGAAAGGGVVWVTCPKKKAPGGGGRTTPQLAFMAQRGFVWVIF